MVFSSALRGAGDTRFVMLATLGLAVSVMLIPTFVGIVIVQCGILSAWWFITGYVTSLGTVFFARFRAGVWRTMRVIEPMAAEIELPQTTTPLLAVEPVNS